MVDAHLAGDGRLSRSAHVASLSAAYPLGALVLAPYWGWLADRRDYRLILRIAMSVLAIVSIPIGTTSLPILYGLRIVSGIASGAIVPIALLGGARCGGGMLQQAHSSRG
jgi:MFS family permease